MDFFRIGEQEPYNDAYWFAMVMAFVIFDMTIGFEVGFHSRTMHFSNWTKITIAMYMPQLSIALLLKGIIGLTPLDPIVWSLLPMLVFVVAVGMGATIRGLVEESQL